VELRRSANRPFARLTPAVHAQKKTNLGMIGATVEQT
jgi:hypothetical protein